MAVPKWCLLLTIVSLAGCSQNARTVLHTAAGLQAHGRFTAASQLLENASHGAAAAEAAIFDRERERLRRIRLDYPYTDSTLYRELTRWFDELPWQEFSSWVTEGRFDSRMIDDTLRFFALSRRNLFWRYPQLNARRLPAPNDSVYEHRLLATVRSIRRQAKQTARTRVLPLQFTIRMRVSIDGGIVPSGEQLRAWLPIPRAFPHQREFTLLSSAPSVTALAPAEAPARSAYFEFRAEGSEPIAFELTYRFTADGVRFPMQASDVLPYEQDDPVVSSFTGEAPHVQFTPRMREASRMVLGPGEPNPLLRARRIFNWMTENFLYSHAEEYSTIGNISQYCLDRRRGDCGQLALLFITLCRLNGVPARWQSGWSIFPGSKTIHDWAEIYLNPYGWVPVDPNMGMEALRYHTTLTWAERREVRDFFFGGLDQYRIAANADHSQALTPKKHTLRSDDVDFQRGEVEFGTTNIYFDSRSYELVVKEARALK